MSRTNFTSTPIASSTLADKASCPCGSASAYADCCGRYHQGVLHLQAPDAASLMRSRYSAYVLGLLDYVRDTWHPDTCPVDLTPNEPGLRWLGLEVRHHHIDDADHASVEFVARNKLSGRAFRLHETSRFVRLEGRWVYVEGDVS